MAETAVNLVLEKLVPFLRDEVEQLRGVHEQVALVKDQLALIRAFLKDADMKAEMSDTSDVVKEWVRQLREASFAIEDVVDKYLFYEAKRRQRREAEGCFLRVAHGLRTARPRHHITSVIGDIMKSMVRLNQARETLGFNQSVPAAGSSSYRTYRRHDLRLAAHFLDDTQLVGIEPTKTSLTNRMYQGESRRTVISVVGEGGLGKTTIVKNVYNQQKEEKTFQCYAWITVSRSLKDEHLLKTMIQNLYEENKTKLAAKEVSETMLERDAVIIKIREFLHGKNYLIVFDDVWDIKFWEGVEFALPADSNSRIIITTRHKGVAEFCRRFAPVHIHELEPLNSTDALKLFLLKAFQFDPEGCPKELMELSQKFVKKCDSLPLAIVAIAGLLSTKERTTYEWQKVFDSLHSRLAADPHLSSFYQVLIESYYDLPYHLKSCLLYFAIFPKNYSIPCVKLIRLWVAEGFVKENDDQTPEEAVEEYLAELISRSLVKISDVYSHGRVKSCRVQDLMHHFILKKCEELNFCQVMKNDEFKFPSWSRRLAIHEKNEDATIENARNYGELRACFLFHTEAMSTPLVESLFSSLKLLVALDFEDSHIEHLPKTVGKLLNLKYLNLRNTKIKIIPKFIGKLQKLETLNLKDTQVQELPAEIYKLVKLRHLLLYSSCFFTTPGNWLGVKLDERIGQLTDLQSLTKVDATDDEGGIMKGLEKLKRMRRLAIILSRHNGDHLCIAVQNMIHLSSLSIQAPSQDGVLDLQSLIYPPPFLKRLYLQGHLGRLPEWIPKLNNVVRLSLAWSGLVEDPLRALQSLPELLELLLYSTYEGEKLHFQEGWFIKLKRLRIRSIPLLKTIKIDERALSHVEYLELGPFPQMEQAPVDIQNLEALKHLYLFNIPGEFVEDLQIQLKEKSKLHIMS